MEQRRAEVQAANPDATGPVPADALTASGSGLDPHISPEYAAYQVDRVAAASGLSREQVQDLVDEHTEQPLFGLLGQASVAVPALNEDLQALAARAG